MSEAVTQPTLVMTGGPLDGTTYPLAVTSKEFVLGSSMDADVQIMLGNVEPHHARLAYGNAGLVIADAGSATGTFVNGEKVESEQPLQEGDRICLGPPGAKGSAKLLVRLPGAGAAPAPEEPAIGVAEDQPLLLDDSPGAPLLLEGDQPAAPPAFGAEPAPPAAPPAADVTGEEVLAAEEVVVGEELPLEATEVPAGDDGALFDSPLPPPPPVAPEPEQPLTAPAPPPEPEPEAPAAQYETDLPSIPFAPSEEPEAGEEPEPLAPLSPPPPPPRPAASRARGGGAGARGRRSGRRAKRSSVPIVPVAGGLILVAALGAAGWWFFLRPQPQVAPPPPQAAQGGAPQGQTDAAPPPGTPHVSALEPGVALPGETILVRGENLADPVSVTIGGMAVDAQSTPEGFRVTMPDLQLSEGQQTELVLSAGGAALEPIPLYVGRSPLVLELDPARGSVGERVVIKGRGFGAETGGNAVTFGGTPGLVLTSTAEELSVVVPDVRITDSPEVPVVVTAGGQASSGNVQYFVSRSTTSAFTPRFFGAPVTEYPGEPLAFVSTKIGPVLLLGGAGERDSTALRAADVSTALNQLVSSARSGRVEIEYRPQPPSVAMAGQVDPILVATAEDAAAYSRAWEAGSRSRQRVGARALAQHWAALLRDYFDLFLYRQRPLGMLALSPRGQVFADIYSEALRRPGGRGIPTSVVYPTSERMAAALSQVALVVSNAQPREEVAIHGRWQGSIDDPDAGNRRFEVRLEVAPRTVTGAMKTWRGSIELRSTLRDIAFSRGTVRFTADLGGKPHKFEGTLDEDTISGSATREGQSPATFTLRYSE